MYGETQEKRAGARSMAKRGRGRGARNAVRDWTEHAHLTIFWACRGKYSV